MKRIILLVIIIVCLTVGALEVAKAVHKPSGEIECIDNLDDLNRLKLLANRALDDAFQTQLKHLYEVWMKDPTHQPERAHIGVNRAIRAWALARKSAKEFKPPLCVP